MAWYDFIVTCAGAALVRSMDFINFIKSLLPFPFSFLFFFFLPPHPILPTLFHAQAGELETPRFRAGSTAESIGTPAGPPDKQDGTNHATPLKVVFSDQEAGGDGVISRKHSHPPHHTPMWTRPSPRQIWVPSPCGNGSYVSSLSVTNEHRPVTTPPNHFVVR